jgi:TM2 domain-containing membrane protein YozV
MYCYIHSQQDAVGSCVECGHGVCLICLNKHEGRIFCDQCVRAGATHNRRNSGSLQNIQANPLLELNALIQEKNRFLAAVLAITLGWCGGHKFYLGQPGWGMAYLLFFWTGIPSMAGFVEGIWYLLMTERNFHLRFNLPQGVVIANVGATQNIRPNPIHSNQGSETVPRALRSESDYERYLLQYARQHQGRITIGQIAADTPISIEKAEHHLARLEAKGHTRVEIDPESGVIRYLFPEFMYPGLDSPESGQPF